MRAGIDAMRSVIDLYEQQGDPPRTWFTGAGRQRAERVFAALLQQLAASMRPGHIRRVVDACPGPKLSAQDAVRALKPVPTWAGRRG